jgi:excisionase family DNA binding protein
MYTDGPPRAALTVAEFCAALSIGRTTFYEQVRAGRIRVLKVGTRTLVPTSEVDAFLQKLAI